MNYTGVFAGSVSADFHVGEAWEVEKWLMGLEYEGCETADKSGEKLSRQIYWICHRREELPSFQTTFLIYYKIIVKMKKLLQK